MNKQNIFSQLFGLLRVLILSIVSLSSVSGQTVYSFTNATATGTAGPTQAMVNTAYASTSLAGQVTVMGSGIQQWVVPTTGIYSITTAGASGGYTPNAVGGKGRVITTQMSLTAGTVLQILVGQEGGRGYFTTGYAGGGGGGSFVINQTSGAPILISGGGGGAGQGNTSFVSTQPGVDAPAYNMTSGTNGTGFSGSWATAGMGGISGMGGGAGIRSGIAEGGSGGGGYIGNGEKGRYGGIAGVAFVNNGSGGANSNTPCNTVFTTNVPGGFGGGAGAGICGSYEANGGGGGGFSGGGGSNTRVGAGGGGGNLLGVGTSYVSSGLNTGNGYVTITNLLTPAGALNFVKSTPTSGNYITVPHSASLNLGASFTIEAWVNYTGTNSTIVDKGDYDYLLQLNCSNAGFAPNKIDFYNRNTGQWVHSTGTVPEGVWSHVAVTLANGVMTFYINGVASGTAAVAFTQDSGPLNIGRQNPINCLCNTFNGSMDELRIWNRALTACEINTNKNCELPNPTSQNGLAAYYKFNQGNVNEDNTSITTVTDASANGNTGTLVGFARTGATSNFVAAQVTGTCAAYTAPVVTASNNGPVNAGTAITLTASGGTNYSWSGPNGFSANVATPSVTISNASAINAGTYTVTGTTGVAGCSATASTNVVVNAAAKALDFGGANDYVDLGAPLAANASYTREAWVFNGNPGFLNNNLFSTFGDPVYIPGGILNVGQGNNYGVLVDSDPFPVSTWTHVAVTYDQPTTTLKLYVNGVLKGTNTNAPAFTGGTLYLGKHPSGGGSSSVGMDEVRFWNRALCREEILNNMNAELNGPQNGLVALYNFNQGFVNANNAGITTLTDASGNGNNGTLVGFTLNGASSNWIAGSVLGTATPFTAAVAPITGNTTLCVGATSTLANSNTGGVWTSSNPSIAGISPLGVVTAFSVGTTTITYTNACGGVSTAAITVNALPTVNAVGNQEVCHNGTTTTAISFSGSIQGTVFNWTNDNPSIGLAANGTGDIASFVGQNTSNVAVIATITVTPSYNGCTGTPISFTIRVNPIPVFNAISNEVVCNGSATNAVSLSSPVAGTTFSWFGGASVGLANGNGNTIPSVTAINTGNNPVTATIIVISNAAGQSGSCGTSRAYTVTVNPTLTVTGPGNLSANAAAGICSSIVNYTTTITGASSPALSYTFSGATTGSGVGNGSGSSFNIGQTQVTVTATNECGMVSTSFTVSVTDTQVPMVLTQPVTVVLGSNGVGTLTAAQVNNGSTDNCGIASMTVSKTSFDCSDIVTSVTNFMTFTSSGSFVVPAGATNVRVLAIGGGGGGANGHQGGGGSGYVQTATIAVTPGQSIPVTVGNGGTGAISQDGNNNIVGLTGGASSSFGSFLTANGGGVVAGINARGGAGGSGGGGSCNGGSTGGAGGAGGSNGNACSYLGGIGQGSYLPSLSLFVNNSITAGAGGAGGTSTHAGGGGAGGILINGTGINGGDGAQSFSGKGGKGYGASGGAGGFDYTVSNIRYAGGNGASGLVYVEWDAPLGVPVTLTVTDINGNTATATATVKVVDNMAPVFVDCPSNITVNATSASGAAVNYTIPTATDNCSAVVTRTAGLASGATFPIGTTTVTYKATDASGNNVTCSFTVTVSGMAPVIVCPANITVNNDPGQCGAVVTYVATATAGIPASTITYSIPSGSLFAVGTTTVTATATNSIGSSTCSFTVTVRDVTPPVIVCAADISVNTTAGCNTPVSVPVPTASDYCNLTSNSLHFDGANDLVSIPRSISGDFTIEYWMKTTQTGPVGPQWYHGIGVVDAEVGGVTNDFGTSLNGTKLAFGTGNQDKTIFSLSNVNTGQWVHVAVTRKQSTGEMILYINGVQESSVLGSTQTLSVPSRILLGTLQTGVNGYYNGNLSKLRLWNKVRTASEIASGRYASLVPQTGLVANYEFNQGNANGNNAGVTVLTDNSGNNSNGSLVNFALTGTTSNWTGGVSTVTLTNSFNNTANASGVYPVGVTNITWTATDAAGNTATCVQTVTVVDNIYPVLVGVPAAVTVQCNVVPAVANVTATDNCSTSAPVFTEIRTEGNCANNYILTRTWSTTDASGNLTMASQVITVVDTEVPVITNMSTITVPAANGQCSAVVNYTASATDNCGTANISYSIASGSTFTVGSHVVTVTATDACGNVATSSFTVTVTDAQPPVIVCAPNQTINMSANCSATLPDYRSLLTATDNCSSPGSLVITQSPAAGTVINGSGTMSINFTVTDAAGNSSNCSLTLTKRDVTAPIITGPTNKQVNTDANLCGAVVKYAPDNAIVFSQNFVQGATNSTYCNAWTTFTNQLVAGNTYTKLTIKGTYDQTGVSVTNPAIIAQIAAALKNGTNGTWSTNGRTWAVGNCGGPGALSATNGYVCNCDQNGYVVRPCIDLQSGYPNPNWGGVNTVTCNSPSQNITVIFEMSGGGNGTGGITATDACNGPVTITQTAGLASGSLFPVGTTTNTFTATDASGNSSTYSFDVTVTDNQRPTITAPVARTVNNAPGTCGATVSLGTPVTADNCGVATVTNNAPAIFPIGTTTVTWTVTDVNGNNQTATQTVTVIDNQPPVIVCPDNIEVYATSAAGAVVTYTAPVGTDNCTGVTTVRTGGPASGSVFPIGTSTITYTVTDAAGLTVSCSFTVTVTGLPPVIVCPADIAVTSTAGQCGTNVTFAATETTAIPASTIVYTENGNVVTSGSFFTVGTHIITATATNPVGSVSCTFTITVTDVEIPVIITPANIAVNNDAGVCGAQISITAPAATDNCGIASVIGVRTDGLLLTDVYPVGITAIMWNATDVNGLTSGHTQLVTVTDNEAPIVITQNVTILLNAAGTASITTSQINNNSTDNCGIATVSLDKTTFNCSNVGANTVTLTVTDIHGNSATQTAVVTVVDQIAPTVLTNNMTIQLDANGTASITAAQMNNNSTDNCGIASISLDKTTFDCSHVGQNTVTLTVTDVNGNSASQTATVTVQDNTAPIVTVPAAQVFCANASGSTQYTIPAAAATDNCSVATVTYAVTGATSRMGTGYDASGAFNIGTSTITWTVTDVNGNTSTGSITVVVNPLPVATYVSSNADAFCNQTSLTASSSINPALYSWSSSNTPGSFSANPVLSLGLTNADGNYYLYTQSSVTGCVSASSAVYNFQKQTLSSSYTILAYKEVELGKYNQVQSGSVGVMTAKGEAEFKSYSGVTGAGSFVKAPKIDKDGSGITLNSQIIGIAAVTLPTMQYNTATTNSLPSLTASQNNATLSGNYKNLTIKKGISVTVSGTTFGNIRLEEGASIRFTSTVLNIENFTADRGAKNNDYTYIRFAPNTSVRVGNKVSIGSQVLVNPESYKVSFYMGDQRKDEEKFTVKGGDTRVIANILMPNGKLRVTATDSDDDDDKHGDCDHKSHSSKDCKHKGHEHNDCDHRGHSASNCQDDVYMTGLFIAEKVESKGNKVIWNSYDCSAPAAPITSVNNSKGVTQSVSEEKAIIKSEEELKVTVMPNPSTTYFTLKLESKYETPVNLRVIDGAGRVVDARSKLGSNSTFQIGHSYSSGTYYAELIQGTKRKVVQLIKARE